LSRPKSITIFTELALAAALLVPAHARAGACCAAGAAAPALITGDEAATLTVAAGTASVIGDAPAEGLPVFRGSGEHELTRTVEVSGATLLSDRWQAGASLPFVSRDVSRGTTAGRAAGLAETRLSVAYEAWPEWEYSAWRPRGHLFAGVTVPLSRSIHDSREPWAADALGAAFWRAGAGALWVKRWADWDALAMPEVHFSFARDFGPLRVAPGWGGSVKVGGGRSWGALRLGLGLQPVYEQPRRTVESGIESRGARQVAWNTGLDAAYALSGEWSASAAYVDQTLLGPAVNSTLSRSFAVQLRRLWPR
jgi:hypothetical protein